MSSGRVPTIRNMLGQTDLMIPTEAPPWTHLVLPKLPEAPLWTRLAVPNLSRGLSCTRLILLTLAADLAESSGPSPTVVVVDLGERLVLA